jgi:hypothetical protein
MSQQQIVRYHRDAAGRLHSDGDKPASEWADGDKHWYQHGERHRDGDKPAIEDADGNKWWYQRDESHRDGDKPATEHANGNKYWYQHGLLHRDDDKPAIELANGNKQWYRHGKLHRDGDRPAIEDADGTKSWVWFGRHCVREKLQTCMKVLRRCIQHGPMRALIRFIRRYRDDIKVRKYVAETMYAPEATYGKRDKQRLADFAHELTNPSSSSLICKEP